MASITTNNSLLLSRASLQGLSNKTPAEVDAALLKAKGSWVQVAPGEQAVPWESGRDALGHLLGGRTLAVKRAAADELLSEKVRSGNARLVPLAKAADTIGVAPEKLRAASLKGAFHGVYSSAKDGTYELKIPLAAIKQPEDAAAAVQVATKPKLLGRAAIAGVALLGGVAAWTLIGDAVSGSGGTAKGGGVGWADGEEPAVKSHEPVTVGEVKDPKQHLIDLALHAAGEVENHPADSPERKRADIASRAMGQASAGVRTTLSDGSLDPNVTAYMTASDGVTPAADRAWNMDFVVWAVRNSGVPIGFDGAGQPTPDHKDFQKWMQESGGLRSLDVDGVGAKVPKEERDAGTPGIPEPGDIVLLDVSFDDMQIDSYGIVGAKKDGKVTIIQGNAAIGDARGVTATTMSEIDGRIRMYVDTSTVKAVARPKPPPPANPYPNLSGDYQDPELDVNLKNKLQAAAADLGVTLFFKWGYRNPDEQKAMWAKYGAKQAARPGTSPHEKGVGADIQVGSAGGPNIGNFPGAAEALKAHGLCLPVGQGGWVNGKWVPDDGKSGMVNEPWHVEIGGPERWRAQRPPGA
ncbi:MAG: D-alanyl-D-alanine carboxypeptidase [Thermoleophilia bacterium]|jgi:hypothetical protein|nr:D-alanyl-D-alanine carboxypeptidase [Thermoleophilia bacterium]